MHRLLVGLLATLGCLASASLLAQDAAPVGQPLATGPLSGQAPPAGTHELRALNADPLATNRATQSLTAVEQPDAALRLRGAKETAIFRALANAVVLVTTKEREGSGSLLSVTNGVGLIITNWHVVRDFQDVGIVFRPPQNDDKVAQADIIRARVIKVDPTRDLALIAVAPVPPRIPTMPLGSVDEVEVGADVHAIGHPIAGNWSYTKGLVSQVRRGYQWGAGPDKPHKADVIQTQTPINPGNSGGPLIADSGRMVGINSFKEPGEGLNFAVNIVEVKRFLADAEKGAFDPKPVAMREDECIPKVLFEGRTEKNDAALRTFDFFCSGKDTGEMVFPDDKAKPVHLSLDTNGDGEIDAVIYDRDRDGKWDISYWDTDFDGKADLVGYHADGAITPSRTEKYTPKAKP
ncbi:hypothetical protein BH11PSE3_BH11PSE3_13460 [soil metagenome]